MLMVIGDADEPIRLVNFPFAYIFSIATLFTNGGNILIRRNMLATFQQL